LLSVLSSSFSSLLTVIPNNDTKDQETSQANESFVRNWRLREGRYLLRGVLMPWCVVSSMVWGFCSLFSPGVSNNCDNFVRQHLICKGCGQMN
jgi:hypothetical protein